MRKPARFAFGRRRAANVSPAPSVFTPPTRTRSAAPPRSSKRMLEKQNAAFEPPVPPPKVRYAASAPTADARSTS